MSIWVAKKSVRMSRLSIKLPGQSFRMCGVSAALKIAPNDVEKKGHNVLGSCDGNVVIGSKKTAVLQLTICSMRDIGLP